MPTRAYKSFDITVLPRADRQTVFRSAELTHSNPKPASSQSGHSFGVQASLWSWFNEHIVDEAVGRLLFRFSKTKRGAGVDNCQMMGAVAQHLAKREHFFAADAQWQIDGQATIDFLHDTTAQNKSVTALGTAFSFVHLLDFMEAENIELRLPAGSAAMETGGYKGRSREAGQTGVEDNAIVGRLGICRNESCANTACAGGVRRRMTANLAKRIPHPGCFVFRTGHAPASSPRRHWTRSPLAKRGCWRSPTNVGSALCVLTEDLAKQHRGQL